MKQEFATLYGKLVIERNTIYLRSPYLPLEKTAFGQIAYELLWMLIFVTRILTIDSSWDTMIAIVFGLLVASRFPNMYDKFLKRSYANRIPFSSIKDVSIEDDHHGLQTEVKLHLKSGRYRSIIFRKLEGQVEPFTALLAPYKQHFAAA